MRKTVSLILILALTMSTSILVAPNVSYAASTDNGVSEEQKYQKIILTDEMITITDEYGNTYDVYAEEYLEVPVSAPYSTETINKNEASRSGLHPDYPVGTRRAWNFSISNNQLGVGSLVAGTPLSQSVKNAIANIVTQRLGATIGSAVIPGLNIASWVISAIATINSVCGNNGFTVRVQGVYSSTYINGGGYYMYGWSLESLSLSTY